MNTFVADPHWGWWIVWYFYLGGIAAGTYFIAALVEFVGDEQDRRMARVGYLLAAPLVAVCGVLLIVDLSQPLRFWHMLFDAETFRSHLKWWSPMSIGAWALLVFGAVSWISFIGALVEFRVGRVRRTMPTAAGKSGALHPPYWPTRLHHGIFGRAFDLIGTGCGFFIASYTGALLTATNQPIWSDSPWIAAMFLASSATGGAAAIRLVGELSEWATDATLAKLDTVDTWSLGLELCTILLFLSSLRTAALPIFELTPIWWILLGTIGLGVFVPLLLRLRPAVLGRKTAVFAAIFVLAGGFVLRYAVLAVVPTVLDRPQVDEQAAISPTPVQPRVDSVAVEELWALIRERLELMETVARVKWRERRPIEDLEREQELLNTARAWAEKSRVPPDAAELFLRAQIDAAKQVQRACLAEWKERPPVDDDSPSLAEDLRPRLDAITGRLLDAFTRSRTTLQDEQRHEAIGERVHVVLGGIRLELAERRELFHGVLRAATISSRE